MRNNNNLSSNSNILSIYFFFIFVALLIVLIIQQTLYIDEDKDEFEEEKDIAQVEEVILDSESESKPVSQDLITNLVIAEGDTFQGVLEQLGISKKESYQISLALGKVYNSKKIKIGYSLFFEYDDVMLPIKSLKTVTMEISETQKIVIKKQANDDYKAEIITAALIKKLTKSSVKIAGSLDQAAKKMHISKAALSKMMKAFSYDIDFQRDIKSGDKLEVILRKLYTKEGKFVGYGDVVYASLQLKQRKVEIYHFVSKTNEANYYGPSGYSVKKTFIKTPISAARISSGFGMRKHPIHGYTRMHKGVDFAAPEGTPILAAADGRVVVVGRKGAYGKYIKIEHGSEYATAYAHLRNFSKGIQAKQFVKQGEVIGYVGTTGTSTGPHLHFEVHKNGKQINPSKIVTTSKIKLSKEDSKVFENLKKKIQKIISSLGENQEIDDII